MTAKTYYIVPGRAPQEDEQWNEILQMSLHCPITRAFVQQVEYGILNREQAAIGLARELVLDRKRLIDRVVSIEHRRPPPSINISVNQQEFEQIKDGIMKSIPIINNEEKIGEISLIDDASKHMAEHILESKDAFILSATIKQEANHPVITQFSLHHIAATQKDAEPG